LKRANLRRKWSTILKAAPAFQTISRHASPRGGFLFRPRSRLLELARVLVCFNHIARCVVNESRDRVSGTRRLPRSCSKTRDMPKQRVRATTGRLRLRNQINAASILAWTNFVNVTVMSAARGDPQCSSVELLRVEAHLYRDLSRASTTGR
jgi:hypothetical protein